MRFIEAPRNASTRQVDSIDMPQAGFMTQVQKQIASQLLRNLKCLISVWYFIALCSGYSCVRMVMHSIGSGIGIGIGNRYRYTYYVNTN